MTENEVLLPVEDEARLTELATEIRTIRRQTETMVLSAACETGKRLIEARNRIPFGGFGAWLKREVEYSERQAQNLMGLYETYAKAGDPQALADLSITKAVLLMAAPDAVREAMIESGEAAELSTRELQRQLRELKEAAEAKQTRLIDLAGQVEAAQEEKKAAEAAAEAMRSERDRATEAAAEARAKAEMAQEEARDAARRAQEALEEERRRGENSPEAQARIEVAERERQDAEKRLRDAQKRLATANEAREAAIREANEARTQAAREAEIVYRVPEDTAAEMARLQEIAKRAPSEAVVLIRSGYDRLRAEFDGIRAKLGEMEEAAAGPYRAAFARGMRMMAEMLEANDGTGN